MTVSAQAEEPAKAEKSKVAKPRAPKPAADLEHEKRLFEVGARAVAGIDEVGRGSMAGPVSVGVAILSPDAPLRWAG